MWFLLLLLRWAEPSLNHKSYFVEHMKLCLIEWLAFGVC
jgi:hypothetical protein